MRHLKVLGLAAAGVAALMGFAGGAAATTVSTTTGGAAATPNVHAVNESGHFVIKNPISTISCGFTLEMTIQSHGVGSTAKGNLSKLEWSGCTNSWHVTTVTPGSFEIHWLGFAHSGTLTSSGMKVDATRLGVTCVYQTNNTHLGLVTGGNPATLDLEGDLIVSRTESSGLCGTGSHFAEGGGVTTSALYVNQ